MENLAHHFLPDDPIDSGVEALSVPGSVKVIIQLMS
jgi:hypothetical protein